MVLYRIDELETIARDGAVLVLKIDGGRKGDANVFTVVLSGGRLTAEEFFRMDGEDLTKLIDRAIEFYEDHT
jgi:hypothetical protein